MKRTCVIATVVLLVACAASARAPQSGDRVAKLFAAARQALGGEARLDAVKRVSLEGPFRREMGSDQFAGNAELLIVKPDRMRRVEEMELGGLPERGAGARVERTSVMAGLDFWEQVSGPGGVAPVGALEKFGRDRGATDLGGPGGADFERDRAARMRAEMEYWSLVLFVKSSRAFTLAGVAETMDGRADILATTDDRGEPIRFLIDQETHLPVGLTFRDRQGVPANSRPAGEPPPEGPSTTTLLFSRYRDEGGLTWPHQIDRAVDNVPSEEWTIRKYRINPSIKPDLFTRK